jgi:hypothetical protein
MSRKGDQGPPMITNWYLKETRPQIGDCYELFMDVWRERAYKFESRWGTYLGGTTFEIETLAGNKKVMDMSVFNMDRFFAARTKFMAK